MNEINSLFELTSKCIVNSWQDILNLNSSSVDENNDIITIENSSSSNNNKDYTNEDISLNDVIDSSIEKSSLLENISNLNSFWKVPLLPIPDSYEFEEQHSFIPFAISDYLYESFFNCLMRPNQMSLDWLRFFFCTRSKIRRHLRISSIGLARPSYFKFYIDNENVGKLAHIINQLSWDNINSLDLETCNPRSSSIHIVEPKRLGIILRPSLAKCHRKLVNLRLSWTLALYDALNGLLPTRLTTVANFIGHLSSILLPCNMLLCLILDERVADQRHIIYEDWISSLHDATINICNSLKTIVDIINVNIQQLIFIFHHSIYPTAYRILPSISDRFKYIEQIVMHGILNRFDFCSVLDDDEDFGMFLPNFLCPIAGLSHLRHLDLSVDREVKTAHDREWAEQLGTMINNLLKIYTNSKEIKLVRLDLSGITMINDAVLRDFLMKYPKKSVLGLCLTEYLLSIRLEPITSYCTILDCASRKNIIKCLDTYQYCHIYMKHILLHLFHITQNSNESDGYVILMLVVKGLKRHMRMLDICMAATACIFNLTRDFERCAISLENLSESVSVAIETMFQFPRSLQLQKNCLVMLCSDLILNRVKFNYYECMKACVSCLEQFPEERDPPVVKMSIAVLSVLASKITSDEAIEFAIESNFKVLVDIPRRKLAEFLARDVETVQSDSILMYGLSCLWNLTDECHKACSIFIDLKGISIYSGILELFKENVSILTKIMGLMNNVAEVKTLHNHFIKDKILTKIMDLLVNSPIIVSFFAAGVIANILPTMYENSNTSSNHTFAECSELLSKIVINWGLDNMNDIVAYRSFEPFLNILLIYEAPSSQLWAVWAIRHVIKLNYNRYRPLMTKSLIECIHHLNSNHNSPLIKTITTDILLYYSNIVDIIKQ